MLPERVTSFFERLEPCAVKAASTVLRGRDGSDAVLLPDWVQDWYRPDYYAQNVNDNPQGPDKADQRVIRGGSFTNVPDDLRVTRRIKNDLGSSHTDVGFRCAK